MSTGCVSVVEFTGDPSETASDVSCAGCHVPRLHQNWETVRTKMALKFVGCCRRARVSSAPISSRNPCRCPQRVPQPSGRNFRACQMLKSGGLLDKQQNVAQGFQRRRNSSIVVNSSQNQRGVIPQPSCVVVFQRIGFPRTPGPGQLSLCAERDCPPRRVGAFGLTKRTLCVLPLVLGQRRVHPHCPRSAWQLSACV